MIFSRPQYERLDNLGHGVQFFHDEAERAVAFLEGFNWLHRPGSAATVRLLRSCPTSTSADRANHVRIVYTQVGVRR